MTHGNDRPLDWVRLPGAVAENRSKWLQVFAPRKKIHAPSTQSTARMGRCFVLQGERSGCTSGHVAQGTSDELVRTGLRVFFDEGGNGFTGFHLLEAEGHEGKFGISCSL